MNRAERRQLARLVRGLEAKVEAMRQAFAEQGRPGRRLYQAELFTIEEALIHPVFGIGTREAVAGAYAAAHGVGNLISECWGCCGHWHPDWAPVAALAVTLDAEMGGLGLLCRTCAALEDPEAEALILRALERDLGFEDAQKVAAATLSPEAGRA
jgi:hypothetical protein